MPETSRPATAGAPDVDLEDRPHLSIVLPVYNEEARIEESLDRLYDWLGGEGLSDGLADSSTSSGDNGDLVGKT